MPKRSRKKKLDLNELAATIAAETLHPDSSDVTVIPDETTEEQKNPAAVQLGRLGGLKGGRARAESLTPKQRSDAAKKAARARWKKQKKGKTK